MVWLGLSIWMRILAKAGEKPKAPHPADFPQGGEEPPHGISLISIWAPPKGVFVELWVSCYRDSTDPRLIDLLQILGRGGT
jgi:hypothetical protein